MRVQVPEAFKELYTPSRYKGWHGGRASAKSHSFAEALAIRGTEQPLRILCAREIQRSIRDSVKRLLDDKIKKLDLSGFYRTTDTEIAGPNGTLFIFAGLRHNIDNIKSMEGIDIGWVEEAHRASQTSLDILRPTIFRNPNAEFWASWNPNLATDPIDKMLRGDMLPPGAIVKEVSWRDNPFLPSTTYEEMDWDKRRDPEKYAHIWEGAYISRSEARVFHNWRVDDFVTPDHVERFYFGGDWGFSTDPTVLIRCWIDGRTLYIDYEAYKIGCEIDYTPALFAGSDLQDPPRWENPGAMPGISGAVGWPITADSSRPETIKYMRRRGFNIRRAKKGPGSVEDGVEFLKSYDIVVHPRCVHTIDELTFYQYKVDPLTEEVLPVLKDKKNHVIDALRYAVESLNKALRKQSGSLGLGGGKSENWQKEVA